MRVDPAQWPDVVAALALEAEALGDGVAWDVDRVRAWWDTGTVTAVAVKEGSQLIAYASAASITPEAFGAIAQGQLDPEDLELDHAGPEHTHHWVGIVITDPAHRGKGAGRRALDWLTGVVDGECIADVYSEGGRALVEKLGWRKVRDGQHPIYVTGSAPVELPSD